MPTPDSRMMATEAPATNGWILGSMRRSYEPAGWNLCDVHHLCCTCCVFQTILLPHGGSAAARPGAVWAEHCLPHPVPEHHHRPRLGAGVLPPALSSHARRGLARDLPPLGEGVRAHLRD